MAVRSPALTDLSVRLEQFLRDSERDTELAVTDLRLLTGGSSRLTYRYSVCRDGMTRDYVLRTDPPPAERLQETDRRLEWEVLRAVAATTSIPIAKPCYFDAEAILTGHPAFISEAIDGEVLVAAAQAADRDGQLALAGEICDVMAAIHAVPLSSISSAVHVPGSWDDYITTALAEFASVNSAAAPQPFVRFVAAWLDRHRPREIPLVLVHGDLETGNLMRDSDGCMRVLDWEWSHVGDPREDIAFFSFLAETVPPDLIAVDRDAFLRRYTGRTGLSLALFDKRSLDYFTVFGGLRIYAGISRAISRAVASGDPPLDVAWVMNWLSFLHARWTQIIAG